MHWPIGPSEAHELGKLMANQLSDWSMEQIANGFFIVPMVKMNFAHDGRCMEKLSGERRRPTPIFVITFAGRMSTMKLLNFANQFSRVFRISTKTVIIWNC